MKLKKHIQMYLIYYFKYIEDGRLTDGKGKTVNFKNTIIIMTSNVGASTIKKQKTIGFTVNAEE